MTYDELRDELRWAVAQTKPGLIVEFHALTKDDALVAEIPRWLDKHYPRKRGWLNEPLGTTAMAIMDWRP